jgi:hypothetical protein
MEHIVLLANQLKHPVLMGSLELVLLGIIMSQ